MSEWSKAVGEAGEGLVKEFLNRIGWGAAQHGLELPCAWPEKHHRPGVLNRQTHGIDYLFSYKSELIDALLQNVVISVKFTSELYPPAPASLFKQHFLDLTSTLECFKNSEMRRDTHRGRMGIREAQDVGVLFWLSNASHPNDDIVGRLQTIHIPDDNNYRAVYIIDNKRIAFLYDSLAFAQNRFRHSLIEFYYHESGRNMNPTTNVKSGSILPVEALTASVLALRVETVASREVTLALFLNDNFAEDSLRRMMGLAQKLSGSWARNISICFPDFNLLLHSNVVQKVKNGFEDKKITTAVAVECYNPDFLSLQK